MKRMGAAFLGAGYVAAVAMAGCLPEITRDPAGQGGSTSASSGTTGAGDGCPAPLIECGGECVDTLTNNQHCGSCNNGCEPGEVCDGSGICALSCQPDLTACNGTCVDTTASNQHCGGCNSVCKGGEICDGAGSCALKCQPGLTECNGKCIDTQVTNQHCGECGNVCGKGEVCDGQGQCAVSCQPGLTECSGKCVDTQVTNQHCGECGNDCGKGEICSEGTCALQCFGGTTRCGDSCVELLSDPANCGSCGNVCGEEEHCDTGTCVFECVGGSSRCGKECVNTAVSTKHCGECDNACDEGQLCVGGTCTPVCSGTKTLCLESGCADLSSDSLNCGECGAACEPDEMCSSGTCVLKTGFIGSNIVSTAESDQINSWVGTPDRIWTLCYRKTEHGASSSTFHSRCDNKGPTIVVAQLSTGRKIGGYAPVSWTSSSGYKGNNSAFLFSLTNNHKHTQNNSNWMYDNSGYGPTFGGGHDWHVESNMNAGYCNLGSTYSCRPGTSGTTCHNDFCGTYNGWSITELEVWY